MGEVINSLSGKYIPEEVIFLILSFIPADKLYNVMRLVCKCWYNIINRPEFIDAHHQKLSEGLVMKQWAGCSNRPIQFLEIKNKCDVQISELINHYGNIVNFSCNGLGLTDFFSYYRSSCVINPITKQKAKLPPFPFPFHETHVYSDHSSLVYAPSMKRYKVVSLGDHNDRLVSGVFTVGSDTPWRLIDTPWNNPLFFNIKALFVGQYLYWTPRPGLSDFFLAFDVENEKMEALPFPEVLLTNPRKGYFIVKGSALALMVEKISLLWEVWVLTDLNTRKWTRLYNIDLTEHRCMVVGEIRPVCMLKNEEVVIFRVLDKSIIYLVYNIKAREMNSFRLSGRQNSRNVSLECVHINSLNWLKI